MIQSALVTDQNAIEPETPAQGLTGQAGWHERPVPPLWSLRDLALVVAFVPAGFILSELLALVGYDTLKSLLGWHVPLDALPNNALFLLALQLVFYALFLVYLYFLISGYHRQPFWKAIQWSFPTVHRTVQFILGGLALAVLIRFAPALLPDRDTFPLEELFRTTTSAYAVAAFSILVAPPMEELIFRGVLFPIFERQAGLRAAIGATAIVFAAVHVPEYWGAWNHVFFIVLVGLVFSLARGLTGSLAPSVLLHLAYNAGLMTFFYLETKHFRALHALLWNCGR